MSNQSPQHINDDLLDQDTIANIPSTTDSPSSQFSLPQQSDPTNLVEIEEDSDMMGVLDALIELHQLDASKSYVESYQHDYLTIVKAININEQMQFQVSSQIEFIDEQLELNSKTMTEARHSANAENRFGQRLFVHNDYPDSVNYFDKSELLESAATPVSSDQVEEEEESEEEEYVEEEEDNNVDSEKSLPNKAWSRYERNRLVAGIQSEAKRTIAYDFMKKDEAWRVWDVDKIDQSELENFPVSRLDWNRISTIHVHSRTANECLMQWTTQEHPIINKTPWSKQESERLSHLVDTIGLNGQWEQIARELATNRTISQCFSHYMADKNNKAARSLKWTPEEDKKLSDAVKIFGNCNWQQVAAMLKGRTGQQCLHRWAKSINPAIKRTKWTDEESELLKRAVQLYGVGNWKKIQRLIPGRTDMQCRERWVNILTPTVKRTKMTEDEVQQLVAMVEEVGPKWSYIASFFPGRTDNNMLREYNAFINKDKREAEANERELKKLELKKQKEEAKAEKLRKKEEALQEKIEKKEAAELKKQLKMNAPKKKRGPTKKQPAKGKRKASVDSETEEDEEHDDNELQEEHEAEEVVENIKPGKRRKTNKSEEEDSSEDEYKPSCAVVSQTRVTRSQRRQQLN